MLPQDKFVAGLGSNSGFTMQRTLTHTIPSKLPINTNLPTVDLQRNQSVGSILKPVVGNKVGAPEG